MPFFIGIVSIQDIKKGNWTASYTLHWTSANEFRTLYPGINQDLPKVITPNVWCNLSLVMIKSMCCVGIRVKDRRTKKVREFYPKGALCWFPCDKTGEQIAPPIYILNTPVHQATYITATERKKELVTKKSLKKACSFERKCMDLETSNAIVRPFGGKAKRKPKNFDKEKAKRKLIQSKTRKISSYDLNGIIKQKLYRG